MKTNIKLINFLAAFLISFTALHACLQQEPEVIPKYTKTKSIKVFPGAEGFGTDTPAGRGGKIIKVTNLKDSGPGSLRAAVQTPGPRIIVFEISGVINTQSAIEIEEPFVTIAGQTAPPPGITLSGYGLQPATHDVLIQHIFIRITSIDAKDGVRIHRGKNSFIFNVVIDHVSIAWANDENTSIVLQSGKNFSYSNCLIGEGHYGVLIDHGNRNVSMIKNLLMGATQRHPRIKGDVSGVVANNVFYNCGNQSFAQIGSTEGPNHLSFFGNVFIAGPSTHQNSRGVNVYSMKPGSKLYVPVSGADRNMASGKMYSGETLPYLTDIPPMAIELGLVNVAEVENYVAAHAGARPAEREMPVGDAVDKRLILEMRGRKGTVTDREKPAWTKPVGQRRSFAVLEDPDSDADGDGYTNFEEILHAMAAVVEGSTLGR